MAETIKKKEKKSNSKLRLRVQAYEPHILDASMKEILGTINRLNVKYKGPVPLPTKIRKQTVNRSSFIFKNSREQFEVRTHYRLLDIENPSSQAIDALGILSLPAGVSIDIQMVS